MAGRLRRKAKELIGGRKTHLRSKDEEQKFQNKLTLRRRKNRQKKLLEKGKNLLSGKNVSASSKQTKSKSMPTYAEWLKRKGFGATAATLRQYNREVKGRE